MIAFLLLAALALKAQSNDHKIKFGGWHIGYSVYDQVLPDGWEYNPVVVAAYWQYPLSEKKVAYALDLIGEFQINPVIVQSLAKNRINAEAGLNFGIRFDKPFGKNFHIIFGGGIGPHYIDVSTSRQSRGFIFSDHLLLGIHYDLNRQNLFFEIQSRFRHISNAGLKKPNGGINNAFLGFSLGKRLFNN